MDAPCVREVPEDYPSLVDALADVNNGARHLRIAADYEEPEDTAGWDVIRVKLKGALTLEGIGDSRTIVGKGLALERFEEPAVHVSLHRLALGHLSVSGFVILHLTDCEIDGEMAPRRIHLDAAMDVSEGVELSMRNCAFRNAKVGLRVRFPAKATIDASFEGNRIGLALLDNPEVRASSSTFKDNEWANAIVQCRWNDGPILVQQELPTMEQVEVALDGPWGSIGYKKWPLPTEQKVFPRKKKTSITVDVSPAMVHCDRELGSTRLRTPGEKQVGSSWAREVLGLGAGDVGLERLGTAYRKRAREVHPDKTTDDSVPFLRLRAAYDVLRQEIKKSRIK